MIQMSPSTWLSPNKGFTLALLSYKDNLQSSFVDFEICRGTNHAISSFECMIMIEFINFNGVIGEIQNVH